MKKYHKVILLSLILLMFFMLSFSTQYTYAYWSNFGSQDSDSSIVTLGEWSLAPNGISYYNGQTPYATGDLVWFNGQIWEYHGSYALGDEPSLVNDWTVYNDINWYSEITYYQGDIVLFNENIYTAQWQNSNQNPETTGVTGPWEAQVTDTLSWQTGQASELNNVVYHEGALWIYKGYYTTSEPGTQNDWALYGDLTFSLNYVYADNDIVEYNGNYYITTNGGWATGSTPGTNGAWTQLTVPAFNGSVPNNTSYTTYNGLFYVALQGKVNGGDRNIVPGSAASKGIWQALNTQQWQQYNTYVAGDLVMYQSNVYELVNEVNSSDIPGTTPNSWNGMATIYYNPLNTYTLGEYVVYNGEVYVVVNETNANTNAPGTLANAWNQVTGYNWYSFNVYQIDDVVYYNDAVYKALQQTTNEQPDISSTSWALYQTT